MVRIPSQPRRCGPWLIGKEIGCGNFGAVFRCQNTTDKAAPEKAIKVVYRLAAVVGEILAASRGLHHRNIVYIEDIARISNQVYVVMEFCDGPQLFDYAGCLSGSDLLRMTRDLILAVIYLHRHGLVHRDVKPDNVVVVDSGDRVVLVDLGSMRKQGSLAVTEGTLAYQPPELKSHQTPRKPVLA